jgi:hypothetical protein
MNKREWRPGPRNTFYRRAIYTKDFPKLINAMVEDGLICILDQSIIGYTWYIEDYPIQPKAIKEVWDLSDHQYGRLLDWILVNDPFKE